MTAVLTLSVILFGVLSYFQLPVNDLPAVDYPVIQVQVGYPGASPDTIANNIATPLERQFMQINGLEVVTSQSTQGVATLTLQFALEKNIDAAATDVQTGDLASARQSPGGPSIASDLFQEQSERSVNHVYRVDERLGYVRSALRLREHPGRSTHQHPARRFPR
jgi:HAE1 family hydrophobic/amphiphilic exporter-1